MDNLSELKILKKDDKITCFINIHSEKKFSNLIKFIEKSEQDKMIKRLKRSILSNSNLDRVKWSKFQNGNKIEGTIKLGKSSTFSIFIEQNYNVPNSQDHLTKHSYFTKL